MGRRKGGRMLAFCRITGRRENRGDEKILRMDLHVDGIPEWLSDAGAGRLCRDFCVDRGGSALHDRWISVGL